MKDVLAKLLQRTLLTLCACTLIACGDSSDESAAPAAPATPVVPVSATDPDPNESEPARSAAALDHVRAASALQATSEPIRLRASGAALAVDTQQYTVYVNDKLVSASALGISGDTLSITSALSDGRNEVLVFAPDAAGAPVEAKATVWAGSSVVEGRVVDESGNPVAGAVVTAALGDDSTVTASGTTDAAGRYSLGNFPGRTVLVSAVSAAGVPGNTASVGGLGFPDIVLITFGTPVATANGDFQAGLAGWVNRSGASMSLVDHSEAPGPLSAVGGPDKKRQADPKKDLRVGTSGVGPRTVTYTFTPAATAKTVKVRYRFQTTEFPKYFGSEFNDSFSLALRTASGTTATSAGAMNELGKAAFDSTGSTAWKELTLSLPKPGEAVQVDVTVANVGDGIVDSALIVDVVSTSALEIKDAKLFDIDNTPLTHLSAASHTYFGGNTRVHATFKVVGEPTAKLTGLTLKVLQAGALKAQADLVSTLSSSAYTALGANGVQVSTAQLAFEIAASALAAVDTTKDGLLSLKLEAKTDDGGTTEKDLGTVNLLDQWKGTLRYGNGRDEAEGGDDWVRPSARDVLTNVTATWGDFSNMNGGKFPPHTSHRTGQDIDGWFPGYNAINAATATKMIALLNTPGVGSKVKIVYVTHTAAAGNAFYDAYKDVVLADGRPAKAVIKNFADHATHFHWNIQ